MTGISCKPSKTGLPFISLLEYLKYSNPSKGAFMVTQFSRRKISNNIFLGIHHRANG